MPTPKIVIRPMRPEDREQVFAISAQIWGGEDYIPYVWEEWLADPKGQFSAVTLRGRVVAIAKLTDHGTGEWWMEGLRVDPKARGKGIARFIHDAHMALAAKMQPGMIRYATGGDNRASQHLGMTSGFQLINQYVRMHAPALGRDEHAALEAEGLLPPPLLTWHKADLPELEKFLQHSARLRADHGLYTHGWTWYELTTQRLHEHVARRQALGWRDEQGRIAALVIVTVRDDAPVLRASFIDARLRGPLGLADLGTAVRDLARRRRFERVVLDAPSGSRWQRALARAGFALEWDEGDTLWLLERPVP